MAAKTKFARISLSWVLIACTTVVALIALNRGIDLLWGVFVVLLVAIIVAALLPKWQLKGVTARRKVFPSEGVVGQALDITYEITAKGPVARYGVELQDRLSMNDGFLPVAYLPSINGTRDVRLRWTPTTRGCWHVGELKLASCFPLGLTRTQRVIDADSCELLIYPDSVPLRSIPLEAETHPNYEQTISRRRSGRDEFFGVRDYRPGDEVRAIHWRAVARRNEMIVKEFEHQQDRRIWIFLDLSELSHVGHGAASTVEYMVKIAHSVAVQANAEGIAVGMYFLQADELHRIDAGLDRDSYLQLRNALARVNTEHQPSLRTWIAQRAGLPEGGTWLLFNLWQAEERASILATAAQHHAKPLIVEFEKESFLPEHASSDKTIAAQRAGQGSLYRVGCGADLRELFKSV